MTERETTLDEGSDATEDFVGSPEHDVLMANIQVRYYTAHMAVANCDQRMGAFCGRILFPQMQASPEMPEEVRDQIESELAWFQKQWEKRWTRLGERLQKEHRLPEVPRPAMSMTKDGVFFMMGTGRGPV